MVADLLPVLLRGPILESIQFLGNWHAHGRQK
jgi:hypothetical protein